MSDECVEVLLDQAGTTFNHLSDYRTALLKEPQYIFPFPYGVFACLSPYCWVFYCPPNGGQLGPVPEQLQLIQVFQMMLFQVLHHTFVNTKFLLPSHCLFTLLC